MDLKELQELIKGLDFSELSDLVELVPGGEEWLDIFQMIISANSAQEQGQWQTAESLWERIVMRVETIDLLPIQLAAKSRLADVYRMLGKDKEALALYTQIIGLASDPRMLERLQSDAAKMKEESGFLAMLVDPVISAGADIMVADAFHGFVNVGSELPELPIAQLNAVLDEGFRFLETIGHPEWGHMYHSERADLLSEEGRFKEALDEARLALAMRQHDPDGPGYGLTTHLCQVGDCLNEVGNHQEAIKNFEQVLQDSNATKTMKRRAYAGLGEAHLALGNIQLAEESARKELELAQQMESPVALRAAYSFLSLILSKQGKIDQASQAAAQMWIASRRLKGVAVEFRTWFRCGEVRLNQARSALRLGDGEEIPTTLNDEISLNNRNAARHYALSAQRWFDRAKRPANQLDARAGVRTRQDEIAKYLTETAKILALTA